MRILFYSPFSISPTGGGVQRITYQLASSFKSVGVDSYLLYTRWYPNSDDSIFVKSVRMIDDIHRPEFMKQFIIENSIDRIIVQGDFWKVRDFRKAIEGMGCKLLFCLHMDPDSRLKMCCLSNLIHKYRTSENKKERIRQLEQISLLPFARYRVRKALTDNYRMVMNECDKVILLSDRFVSTFRKYLGGESYRAELSSVGNMLSFDTSKLKYSDKTFNKLISVSRLYEPEKKISILLKLWRLLEKDKDLNNWSLDIIGDGQDSNFYKRMSARLGLTRVRFLGEKDPTENYASADIFVQTSITEGFGISLIEAMQNGVVPVVFDSYSALGDIVQHNINGIVVRYNDIGKMADEIRSLIKNEEKRRTLSLAAIRTVQQFSPEVILGKWQKILS